MSLFTSSACTGSPAAQGSAANLGSPGLTASVADDSSTAFRATATDASGNTSACSGPITYVEDSTAPNTTIDSGPLGPTNDPTPTFAFASSEAGSSFECKIDSNPYATCTSPKTVPHGTDGSYTFYVRGIDQAGNTDPTPASRSFTIETPRSASRARPCWSRPRRGPRTTWRSPVPQPRSCGSPTLPAPPTRAPASTQARDAPEAATTRPTADASGIVPIQVASRDQDRPGGQLDRRSAARSSGGGAGDTLIGGSNNDMLTGEPGADVMKGMNGNDQLLARDGTSDTTINATAGGPRAPPTRPTSTCSPRTPLPTARPTRGTEDAGLGQGASGALRLSSPAPVMSPAHGASCPALRIPPRGRW